MFAIWIVVLIGFSVLLFQDPSGSPQNTDAIATTPEVLSTSSEEEEEAVVAEKAPSSELSSTREEVTPATTPDSSAKRSTRRFRLEGRVVGEDRVPLVGVAVQLGLERLAPGAEIASSSIELAKTYTDDQGRYHFSEIPLKVESGMCVAVRAANGEFACGRVRLSSDVLRFRQRFDDLVLERGGRIVGRVVDQREKPIRGARLEFHLDCSRVIESDAEGNFDSGALPVGRCIVRAFAPDFARSGPLVCDVIAEKRIELPVKLVAGASFSGMIIDERGRPLPNASIEISSDRERRPVSETGRFAYDDLLPGTVDVVVRAPGFGKSVQEAVTIPSADRVIELRSSWTIEGIASETRNGGTVSLRKLFVEICKDGSSPEWSKNRGRRIEFRSSQIPWLSQRIVTGQYPSVQIGSEIESLESSAVSRMELADTEQVGALIESSGRFIVDGNDEGVVLLVGVDEIGRIGVAGPFSATQGVRMQGVQMDFQSARQLDFMVCDEGTKIPIAAAKVRARPLNDEFCPEMETDAEGRAALTELHSNFVEVQISKPGFETVSRKCRVPRVGERSVEQVSLTARRTNGSPRGNTGR